MTRASFASKRQCPRVVRPCAIFVAVILLHSNTVMGLAPLAVSMSSHYKPPVKSSVKKLHDRRFSRDPRISADRGAPSSHLSPSSTRTTSSSYAAASAYAPPLPTSEPTSKVASFERRMREALFGVPGSNFKQSETTAGIQRRTATQLPANVKTVESLQDFKTIVGDETEKMVVVRFHATYCRACNAVAPHFYKLASLNPNVVFVDVPVSEKNAVVHQGLGVPSLPYAHIYHPEAGLVEEHKLTRKEIADFRHKLQTYLDGSCDIITEEEEEEEDFAE